MNPVRKQAEARREGLAVVLRNPRDNSIAGEGGIHALVVAGSTKRPKVVS